MGLQGAAGGDDVVRVGGVLTRGRGDVGGFLLLRGGGVCLVRVGQRGVGDGGRQGGGELLVGVGEGRGGGEGDEGGDGEGDLGEELVRVCGGGLLALGAVVLGCCGRRSLVCVRSSCMLCSLLLFREMDKEIFG